jgi:NADPH:quinone reductase-like Zn-dependent oxidoreductase
MRVLRFEKKGSLDWLVIKDIPTPIPGTGEVLVQVKAAAVNPSDIKNVLGAMHETTVPRTPGRDFAGIVVKGPDALTGTAVFGSGGNLGFGRDGSHAEFVVVPENAVVPMPKSFSFEQSAAIGVAYLTASAALLKAAQLQSGETALVLGTSGAVGSAAARIARRRGARVVGTVRKTADLAHVRELPVDVWVNLETTELPAATRAATNGKGADVVFDLVGGSMFEKCLSALAWRGRQVAISSSPEPRVSFNLVDFYHNESRLFGVDSLKVSFAEAADILRELLPGFESGEFPAPEVQSIPLDDGPEIYRSLYECRVKGKFVLRP